MSGCDRNIARRYELATPEEDAVIKRIYPKGGARAVQKHLTEWSNERIWARAKALKLRRINTRSPEPEPIPDEIWRKAAGKWK